MWEDNIYGTVGPQSDGTIVYPVQDPQPVDAGGGAAGSYGQQILDVFKWGVGVWQQNEQQNKLLDYKRWEATQNGLAQQGQTAGGVKVAQGGGVNTSTLLVIGGAVLVAVLVLRG